MSVQAEGWAVFPAEAATSAWCNSVLPAVKDALEQTERRHGGTWAPGVDLLGNDTVGAVEGGPALVGVALEKAQALFGDIPLHRAQISAVWPGYPRQDAGESDANHRFRARRDAAHLDGLLPEGPARRRHLREAHAWVLGIGLSDAQAAPLVIWPGSVALFRAAFQAVYSPHPPEAWGDLDVTDLYQQTRREVFARCPRVEVPLRKGEAVLLDRHMLHGTAPWSGPEAGPRVTAFFRPHLPRFADWL